MNTLLAFRAQADIKAQQWLHDHPAREPRVIAYDVTRCCGGGRVCVVSVRDRSPEDDLVPHATAVTQDGTTLLIDPRAAARLPARFGLTVRGLGPFRHLDLQLDGDAWARLLFD